MGNTFVWTERYSVNVKILDDHHKKLFALLDQLHQALLERRGREVIGEVIDELLDYTRYHFTEEEKKMETAKCSGIAAQKKAHQDFVKELKNYKEKLDNGMGAFITTNVMKTLNDWLVNHIGRLDKLYSESMNAAGFR
jgi:hemerythrin